MLARALQLWAGFSPQVEFSSPASDYFFLHVITSIPTTQCKIPTNAFLLLFVFTSSFLFLISWTRILFTQFVRWVTACNMTDGRTPRRGPGEEGSRGSVFFKSDSNSLEPVCCRSADYWKIRCSQPITQGENATKQKRWVLFGAMTAVVLSKYRFWGEKLSTVAQMVFFFIQLLLWENIRKLLTDSFRITTAKSSLLTGCCTPVMAVRHSHVFKANPACLFLCEWWTIQWHVSSALLRAPPLSGLSRQEIDSDLIISSRLF